MRKAARRKRRMKVTMRVISVVPGERRTGERASCFWDLFWGLPVSPVTEFPWSLGAHCTPLSLMCFPGQGASPFGRCTSWGPGAQLLSRQSWHADPHHKRHGPELQSSGITRIQTNVLKDVPRIRHLTCAWGASLVPVCICPLPGGVFALWENSVLSRRQNSSLKKNQVVEQQSQQQTTKIWF